MKLTYRRMFVGQQAACNPTGIHTCTNRPYLYNSRLLSIRLQLHIRRCLQKNEYNLRKITRVTLCQ